MGKRGGPRSTQMFYYVSNDGGTARTNNKFIGDVLVREGAALGWRQVTREEYRRAKRVQRQLESG